MTITLYIKYILYECIIYQYYTKNILLIILYSKTILFLTIPTNVQHNQFSFSKTNFVFLAVIKVNFPTTKLKEKYYFCLFI